MLLIEPVLDKRNYVPGKVPGTENIKFNNLFIPFIHPSKLTKSRLKDLIKIKM